MPAKALDRSSSSLRVVAVPRAHQQVFLFRHQVDLAVRAAAGCIGGVAQAVLVAQFLLNTVIDFSDRQLPFDLEESAAGFPREALQNLLAVGTRRLRHPAPSAAPAHAGAAEACAVTLRVGEQNGVDQRVGAL